MISIEHEQRKRERKISALLFQLMHGLKDAERTLKEGATDASIYSLQRAQEDLMSLKELVKSKEKS